MYSNSKKKKDLGDKIFTFFVAVVATVWCFFPTWIGIVIWNSSSGSLGFWEKFALSAVYIYLLGVSQFFLIIILIMVLFVLFS